MEDRRFFNRITAAFQQITKAGFLEWGFFYSCKYVSTNQWPCNSFPSDPTSKVRPSLPSNTLAASPNSSTTPSLPAIIALGLICVPSSRPTSSASTDTQKPQPPHHALNLVSRICLFPNTTLVTCLPWTPYKFHPGGQAPWLLSSNHTKRSVWT